MSRFDGYRCYNGCPDSTMQKRIDEELRIEREAARLVEKVYGKKMQCVYFPAEAFYIVFAKYEEISKQHKNKMCALFEVIDRLENK